MREISLPDQLLSRWDPDQVRTAAIPMDNPYCSCELVDQVRDQRDNATLSQSTCISSLWSHSTG